MKNILSLLLATILITGCSAIPQQSFNAEANKNIKTVTLLEPPMVKKIGVGILHHPGASFGLIGAAIAAADTAGKTADYNNTLASNKVDWSAYTQQLIRAKLQQSGYTVTTLKARKENDKKQEFMEKYPDIKTDAILDYYYGVSHLATGPTTDYIPTVTIYSRLVKSSDKSVIYAQHFTSGNPAMSGKGATVSPVTTGFKNIATLKSRSKESVQALKSGVTTIAGLIGKDLKK